MRNNNIMLFKNLPASKLIPVFVSRLFLDGVAAMKFLVDGGVKDMWAVVRAHWRFFSMIPQLFKDRSLLKQGKVSKIYRKNLVYDYFLKGKKTFNELDQEKFS